jgi:hypothetical protein
MSGDVDSDFLTECGFGEQKEEKYSDEYEAYLTNLRIVASTQAGVNIICYWLAELGTFEPSWSDKNPKLARQAVLKDLGNDILDDLAVASEKIHDAIQREMRTRRKRAGSLYKLKPKEENNDGQQS